MKLHLPKLLLTAVMAACVGISAPSYGAVDVSTGETMKVETATENETYNVGVSATLDINGKELKNNTITLAEGAKLTNTGTNLAQDAAQIKVLTLTGDASVEAGANHNIGMIGGNWARTTVAMDGHTLTKTGDGTFFINNTDVTGNGIIDVSAGTLQICVTGTTGDKNVSAAGTEFKTSGASAKISLVSGSKLIAAGFSGEAGSIQGSGSLQVGSDTSYTYNGTVTGGMNLTKVGSGTQTFAGTATLGTVQVNAGGLKFSGSTSTISKLIVSDNVIEYDGGSHTITNLEATATQAFNLANDASLAITNVTFDALNHNLDAVEGVESDIYFTIDGGVTRTENGFKGEVGQYILFSGYEWNGDLADVEVIKKDGNTLVGINGVSTVFYVNKGTVTYDATTMAAASAYVVGAEGTYSRDKGNSDVNINDYLSNITAEAGSDIVVQTTGNVTQSGALTIAEGGSLTISGASSFSNGNADTNPSISGGLLVLNNVADAKFYGDRKISANVSLTGNTTLTMMLGDCVNYNKSSAYIWTVGTGATLDFASTRQAFTNGSELILAGGTVTGVGDDYGAIDMVESAKLTIKATADSDMSATVRLRNGSTILFDVAENATLNMSGLLKNRDTDATQKGMFTKTGAGTLELSGANTYSGGTDINAGTVKTGNASALGTGAVSVAAGASLELGSSLTVSSNLTIAEGGSLIFGNGTKLTVSGTLTLDATAINFAKDITFSSADAVTLATAGTLAVTGVDSWKGEYTIGGKEYTAGLSAVNNVLSLNFEEVVTPENPSITTTLPTSVTDVLGYEKGMLTLQVEGLLTENTRAVVDILGDPSTDGLMKQVLELVGETKMVAITLVGTAGGELVADAFDKVVFVNEKGEGYYGEMVGGQLMYNVDCIPEPASATLSLAALMMLCARRRRRA